MEVPAIFIVEVPAFNVRLVDVVRFHTVVAEVELTVTVELPRLIVLNPVLLELLKIPQVMFLLLVVRVPPIVRLIVPLLVRLSWSAQLPLPVLLVKVREGSVFPPLVTVCPDAFAFKVIAPVAWPLPP